MDKRSRKECGCTKRVHDSSTRNTRRSYSKVTKNINRQEESSKKPTNAPLLTEENAEPQRKKSFLQKIKNLFTKNNN
ncbi:hypothetical protein [Pontibacillus marinus]|uniref:Uncharacterized protein n=1 Tax=Pontibacillus marinus BH030004 = DSM 16465 TaxID=1385511 RepID=A0A0A5GAH6_9BACI|nr:hypothetical protein [Pontibacillus marinus]KGX90181.1 hypothetical protein N783_01430 [Pontibacillus marinus BH030004 = DSM 16465]